MLSLGRSWRVKSTRNIHAFSDASEKAIATVIYFKSVSTEGNTSISLLYAQAKLSPKQATTIHRLELCAAVLSVSAVNWITRELKLNITKIVFYTDSKVGLGYIRSESKRFYVYVANRVEIVRSISNPDQWRFVESKDNPADIATRGKTPLDLKNSLWFRGPDFLKVDSPPQDPTDIEIKERDPEIREEITTYASQSELSTKGLGSKRFQRFSKWSTLRRALALLIKKAASKKAQRNVQLPPSDTQNTSQITPQPHLSLSDLKKAESLMMQTVQRETYTREIQSLDDSTSRNRVSSQKSESPVNTAYSRSWITKEYYELVEDCVVPIWNTRRSTRQSYLNLPTLPPLQFDITTRTFITKASKSHTGEYVTQEFGS